MRTEPGAVALTGAEPPGRADAVRQLAQGASVELLAREVAGAGAELAALRQGTEVYVPFPPRAAWADTVAACRRLLGAGLRPVPHLAARTVPSQPDLGAWLDDVAELGVDSLMLVAGDRDHPAGPYRDTLDVLESGLLNERGFHRLGVAAYPEGHPRIDSASLERALARKIEYAAAMGAETGSQMWIVTQFAFSAAPAIAWLERLCEMPLVLPVRVGLPGPTPLKKLLAFAARCGVGTSLRMARRRPGVVRLLGNWSPDESLCEFAAYRSRNPATALAGIHLFAFGGLAATARWLDTLDAPLTRRPLNAR